MRTDTEMLTSGQWAKIGTKHYRHASGIEIEYDCMAWGWKVSGVKGVWSALWVARYEAEKLAA